MGEFVYTTAPSILLTHCFTTRFGGVSEGPLESLNLGENRGDKPENVKENYRVVRAALGFESAPLCFTKQVHKTDVRVVTAHFFSSRSRRSGRHRLQPDRPCACVLHGDSRPALCDLVAHVAGAIHCGWRSTVADILDAAVEKMVCSAQRRKTSTPLSAPALKCAALKTGPEVAEGVSKLLGSDGRNSISAVPGTANLW